MRIGNDKIFDTPPSMGADIQSRGLNVNHAEHFSIQLVFSGSPNGTFTLEASNDLGRQSAGQDQEDNGVVNWSTIDGSSINISAAGSHLYEVQNAGYRWVRLVYTRNSGTGTIDIARVNTKGVV